MGVITYFIPYLYLFAAMFKLQSEPADPDIIRVPGGKPVAKLVALVGLATTTVTIAISVLPPPDEPNKLLAVVKIIGLSGLMVLIGVAIFFGQRFAVRLRNLGNNSKRQYSPQGTSRTQREFKFPPVTLCVLCGEDSSGSHAICRPT